MNILVCLKIVSQAQFSDTLSANDDRLSGGQLGINPADMYALELALRAKDKVPGTVVTVITMAPGCAEHSLRTAIAAGADRAVLISDSRAAGSDTLVTARVLAAAIRKLPPQQLILCGRKAIDSETGHIGPQLAELLDIPLATGVLSFSLSNGQVGFVCARDGFTAEYSGALPAVLTVCNGTDMVRSPTILGLRRSKNADILRFDLDSLGISPDMAGAGGSPTRTVNIEETSFKRGGGCRISGASEGTAKLLEMLKKRPEGTRYE